MKSPTSSPRHGFTDLFRYLAAFAVLFVQPSIASTSPVWERYGSWEVAAVNGDMDPTSVIVVKTKIKRANGTQSPYADLDFMPERYKKDTFEFGFTIVGTNLVRLHIDIDMHGKNYWPFCDFDMASYRVDGGNVKYVPSTDGAGACNRITMSPSFLRELKAGKSIRLKLHALTAEGSLDGFAAAWSRAVELARKR